MAISHQRNSPIREKLLAYGQQWIDDDDIAAVVEVLRGDYITQGPKIHEFEQKIASYVGAKYAVAFCNGTAALHGACYTAGIEAGDEVITSPLTFLASSNCVLYQGGTPVFADINPNTYNIDPDEIAGKITELTKAIIAVDFAGQPAEMDRIQMLAKEHNLIVIEDAAHSLGASFGKRKVGTLADMTMFSFHPVKHITTGEGGMIVTNREDLYKKLLLFRSHGVTKDPDRMVKDDGPWYYEMHELGYNYRMTDLQAALGISQMTKLENFVQRRREIAAQYNEAFSKLEGLVVPFQHPEAESSWHLYMLRWLPERFTVDRRQIFQALQAENIGVHVHYIPVYLQPYYQRLGYEGGLCPKAEEYYESAITLPLFPKMSLQDVEDVINGVLKIHSRFKIAL
ncbi:UDP-4-amino-4,6-dideoxy-N-acetyl-beta-L-altrosamine transaminase [Paenibacillus sp. MSJ-34]|uniref:UDP-4-amino-4, 6-dideoxy-N-acetyl-beta-L-altrosamine transaminase n=1 Tax=Paenibacillus sp. MSJ-34 TaxID=2841529 RepID=UPI001C11F730|nr:UDP-4-amino-4,6-dideoxy-N-acetyl-beta-L-altrosamine transaminase [Paenibacillus sp. MSJ-34]MBU5441013.1 UDP-4-amino-4,6-dideoxy-N-acetyl-beta-L-altrosamine transaminase [Paenibacillus sp. MSJ-34]